MNAPDFQPTLTGSLVELRPVEAGDWEGMFAAASDPLIWAVHPAHERYKEAEFREFFDEASSSGSAFTIFDRASGAIIGSSRYHGYDAQHSEVEIGWSFLTRACWGGAYNGEVKRLMLDHAFGFASCVVFRIGESNIRSRRAVEKIGGKLRHGTTVQVHHGVDFAYVTYETRQVC